MKQTAVALCVALLLPACNPEHNPRAGAALVEEQLAHHVGVIAYLYGYPMVDMYRRMHNQTHRLSGEQAFYAPLNTLARVREDRWAGWVDTRRAALRVRLSGPPGTDFALIATDFYGQPERISQLIDETGVAELSLAGGRDIDIAGGRSLSPGTSLAHLSVIADRALPPESVSLGAGAAAQEQPRVAALDPMRSLGFFEVFNTLSKELPAPPGDARLLEQFDAIGVGPGSEFSLADLPPARKRGLERALRDARTLLEAALAAGASGTDAPRDVLARAAAYARTAEAETISERSTGADSR